MIWHAVEKKENLYLELTDIICLLKTFYCDENGNYDIQYLEDVIEKMSIYVDGNNNKITLYASEQVKKELLILREIMMKIHSKKLSLISHDDIKELESMVVQAAKIEIFMRKELRISEPQKEKFLYKSNMKEEE